jgi:hypothetical protein
MTRLEAVVKPLQAILHETCSPIGAATIVIQEYSASPARVDAEAALKELATAQVEICRCWDNLRSRLSSLELASGNAMPEYYVGPIRGVNDPKACNLCKLCNMMLSLYS